MSSEVILTYTHFKVMIGSIFFLCLALFALPQMAESFSLHPTTQSFFRFSSPLNSLIDAVSGSSTSADPSPTKITFVGGKGGVGKTSISSALAFLLQKNDIKTLICSTDPAHSLFDALAIPTNDIGVVNEVNDYGLLGDISSPLSAVQLSPDSAIAKFKLALETFDPSQLSKTLGVPQSLVDSLGLSEFSSILKDVPPGLDEVLALGEIFAFAEKGDFSHVVVDTAPTGHTLRLLSLPTFLGGLLTKVVKLRGKLDVVMRMMPGGNGGATNSALDSGIEALTDFQARMERLRAVLEDPVLTQFIVVTIPTKLSYLESSR